MCGLAGVLADSDQSGQEHELPHSGEPSTCIRKHRLRPRWPPPQVGTGQEATVRTSSHDCTGLSTTRPWATTSRPVARRRRRAGHSPRAPGYARVAAVGTRAEAGPPPQQPLGVVVVWRLPMPSGVVKWFDRKRGLGFITRSRGGETTAQSPAVRDDPDRGLVTGQQVRFAVTRDADGDRTENISRPAPGCFEPTTKGQPELPVWPIQSVPGSDAADPCTWCVRMREADTAEQ